MKTLIIFSLLFLNLSAICLSQQTDSTLLVSKIERLQQISSQLKSQINSDRKLWVFTKKTKVKSVELSESEFISKVNPENYANYLAIPIYKETYSNQKLLSDLIFNKNDSIYIYYAHSDMFLIEYKGRYYYVEKFSINIHVTYEADFLGNRKVLFDEINSYDREILKLERELETVTEFNCILRSFTQPLIIVVDKECYYSEIIDKNQNYGKGYRKGKIKDGCIDAYSSNEYELFYLIKENDKNVFIKKQDAHEKSQYIAKLRMEFPDAKIEEEEFCQLNIKEFKAIEKAKKDSITIVIREQERKKHDSIMYHSCSEYIKAIDKFDGKLKVTFDYDKAINYGNSIDDYLKPNFVNSVGDLSFTLKRVDNTYYFSTVASGLGCATRGSKIILLMTDGSKYTFEHVGEIDCSTHATFTFNITNYLNVLSTKKLAEVRLYGSKYYNDYVIRSDRQDYFNVKIRCLK